MSVTRSITKRAGTSVNWSVSAPDYTTQSGTEILNSDKTLNINLTSDTYWATWTGNYNKCYATIGGTSHSNLSSPILKSSYQGDMIYFSLSSGTSSEKSNVTSVDYVDGSFLLSARSMFDALRNCTYINLHNTRLVTDFQQTFRNNNSLQTIEPLDLSSATTLHQAFGGCSSLVNVPVFDIPNVTSLQLMFEDCPSLESVTFINNANVTDMASTFIYCSSLESVYMSNIPNLTYAGRCFEDCSSLTTIPQLNTSSVNSMFRMFYNCSSLTAISELDASSTVDVSGMFTGCNALVSLGGLKNLGKAYDSSVSRSYGSLGLSACPLTHQSALNVLNDLYTVDYTKDYYIKFSDETFFTLSGADISIATSKGWSVINNSGYAKWVGGATSANSTYPTTIGGTNYTSLSSPISRSSYYGIMTRLSFYGNTSLTTVNFIDGSNLTSGWCMFYGCSNLNSIPLFNTTGCTSTSYMFNGCTSLTTIPLLDISASTNTRNMFYNCSSLTSIPILNTSSSTNFSAMFSGCTSLTTIPQLSTNSVTSFNSTFSGCTSLTTVPELNAERVQNVTGMFNNCTSLTTLGGLKNLGEAYTSSMTTEGRLNLSACPLTHQSAVNVLNDLYTVDSTIGHSVTFSITTFIKLTAAEVAVATNKGWSVTYN